jgi:hypothetical protein
MLDSPNLAELHYDMSDYHVLRHGSFVLCAVTGERIGLRDLKYWSVEHQEAYRGAAEACAAAMAGGAANLRRG